MTGVGVLIARTVTQKIEGAIRRFGNSSSPRLVFLDQDGEILEDKKISEAYGLAFLTGWLLDSLATIRMIWAEAKYLLYIPRDEGAGRKTYLVEFFCGDRICVKAAVLLSNNEVHWKKAPVSQKIVDQFAEANAKVMSLNKDYDYD